MTKLVEPFNEDSSLNGRKTYTELQQENRELRERVKELSTTQYVAVLDSEGNRLGVGKIAEGGLDNGSIRFESDSLDIKTYAIATLSYLHEVRNEYIFLDHEGEIHSFDNRDEAEDGAVSRKLEEISKHDE